MFRIHRIQIPYSEIFLTAWLFVILIALMNESARSSSFRVVNSIQSQSFSEEHIRTPTVVSKQSVLAHELTVTQIPVKLTEFSTHLKGGSLLLSDISTGVKATCDVRGNLGPCNVILKQPPGNDWIKDRWQAASDMGGTAIPGSHWVMLEFPYLVRPTKIVLDWETAYSDLYRLEGSMSNTTTAKWSVLFDGTLPEVSPRQSRRFVEKFGQSPGTRRKTPLHIVHTIVLDGLMESMKLKYLRLFVIKPSNTWGVSLWHFDVYGDKI